MRAYRSLFRLALAVCLLSACKPGQATRQVAGAGTTAPAGAPNPHFTPNHEAMTLNNPYFKAGGTAPDWSLEISPSSIVLIAGGETITTPHTEPVRGADANLKRYHLQTEAAELIIEILQKPCDSGSGKRLPYSASIQYRHTADPGLTSLQGCGSYAMDYRLHDIWALESLNGNDISLTQGIERPYMEINSATGEFMGTTSCNQMRGKVFFEPGLLRFQDIATTRKMCPGNLEADFLKALQSSIHYRLENSRLCLTNPNGVELVFRKVD